jgi:hypothetical protein
MILLGDSSAHHAISEPMTFVIRGFWGQMTSKKPDEEGSRFR